MVRLPELLLLNEKLREARKMSFSQFFQK